MAHVSIKETKKILADPQYGDILRRALLVDVKSNWSYASLATMKTSLRLEDETLINHANTVVDSLPDDMLILLQRRLREVVTASNRLEKALTKLEGMR